jgi:hypothetical protein
MLTLVIVVVSSSSSKCRNSNDIGTITVAASYTTSGDTNPDMYADGTHKSLRSNNVSGLKFQPAALTPEPLRHPVAQS